MPTKIFVHMRELLIDDQELLKSSTTLARVVAQLVGVLSHAPSPARAHSQAAGLIPSLGETVWVTDSMIDVSLSLPSWLSKINKHILR